MQSGLIDLKGVQETLLLPLWGRAVESQKDRPLLIDHEAVRIISSIHYDFSQISQRINALSRASWIARSIYFDQQIKEYLQDHPTGTVINIGCGLDTTYERLNNGKAMWYELDLPEVIATRNLFLNESTNRKFLSYSVFDPAWHQHIDNKEDVLIMLAGVIYYFEEQAVKDLFNSFKDQFAKSTLIFDYSSTRGVKIANQAVIKNGGMDESAVLKWGTNHIYEIEQWDPAYHVIENMKMFADHRRKYPLQKRLGMWISDALSVMSLAKITIEK